jgi:hypothetical protein
MGCVIIVGAKFISPAPLKRLILKRLHPHCKDVIHRSRDYIVSNRVETER